MTLFQSRVCLVNIGNAHIARSTNTITETTTWHHCVCTKNGASFAIYIDGVQGSFSVSPSTLIDVAEPLSIAGWYQPWAGFMDEVALYNTSLSAARVQAHYASGLVGPVIGWIRA